MKSPTKIVLISSEKETWTKFQGSHYQSNFIQFN